VALFEHPLISSEHVGGAIPQLFMRNKLENYIYTYTCIYSTFKIETGFLLCNFVKAYMLPGCLWEIQWSPAFVMNLFIPLELSELCIMASNSKSSVRY
jgi:hypothetical protein